MKYLSVFERGVSFVLFLFLVTVVALAVVSFVMVASVAPGQAEAWMVVPFVVLVCVGFFEMVFLALRMLFVAVEGEG